MPDLVRATYETHDIDNGTLVLGYFQEVPFYCACLDTAVATPIATDEILTTDPPAGLNGPDYLEASATATPGNTVTGYVEGIFTYIQSKGFAFSGIVQVLPNFTLDLDQVDATTGGAANVDSVVVELIKSGLGTTVDYSFGVQTHTTNKGVSGNTASIAYAEPTLTELFTFNVGVTPQQEIGVTPGYLLQVRMRINFSAYTAAAATTNTIAKCRLNCYSDLSKVSKILVPVV